MFTMQAMEFQRSREQNIENFLSLDSQERKLTVNLAFRSSSLKFMFDFGSIWTAITTNV
jgi:hypothetical protein